jgi:hypothetical protein
MMPIHGSRAGYTEQGAEAAAESIIQTAAALNI